VPPGSSVVRIEAGAPTRFAAAASSPDGPYTFTLSAAAADRIVRRPGLARFRYAGLP
jgi:hypothetical protein